MAKRCCKITTFLQTRKGMDEISIFTEAQQPGHGSMGKCGGWHLWLSCPFLLKEKDQFCASRTQSRARSNYAEAKQNQQS
jgi:hypothetical protein